jgi:hypothetical protein
VASSRYKHLALGTKAAYQPTLTEKALAVSRVQMAYKIEPIVAHESDSAFRESGELRGDTVKALEELLMNVSSKIALDFRDVTWFRREHLKPAVEQKFPKFSLFNGGIKNEPK